MAAEAGGTEAGARRGATLSCCRAGQPLLSSRPQLLAATAFEPLSSPHALLHLSTQETQEGAQEARQEPGQAQVWLKEKDTALPWPAGLLLRLC